jgi:16S rRNA (guanine527-N7)-methyltransferase
LHSLGIAKIVEFKPGTKILDAGTGGGFPGVPLAILFPETDFHLIDSTGKKLTVVQNIAGELGLKNITTEHSRLEDHRGLYDFVISRAVASLDEMVRWVRKT